MSFKNEFNMSKSNFIFKDKLSSDAFNIFLKQTSLINYSLIDFLTDYYNKFKTVKILDEISIETSEEDVQLYLNNGLQNLMYKTLFEKILIDKVYLDNTIDNAISFKLENQQYNNTTPVKTTNIKINLESPLSVSVDNEKGFALNHNKILGYNTSVGMHDNIDDLWGKTVTVPVLKTKENGHVYGLGESIYIAPNPLNINKVLNENEIAINTTYTTNWFGEKEDFIFVFKCTNKSGSINEEYSISKYFSNREIREHFSYGNFLIEIPYIQVTSSNIYTLMVPFSMRMETNYYNEKRLCISIIGTWDGKNINYNQTGSYGYRLVNMCFKGFAISSD